MDKCIYVLWKHFKYVFRSNSKVNKNGDTFLVGGRGLNYIYCIHNELVNFQYTNEYQVDSIDKTYRRNKYRK